VQAAAHSDPPAVAAAERLDPQAARVLPGPVLPGPVLPAQAGVAEPGAPVLPRQRPA
jgi:hypothetical protein